MKLTKSKLKQIIKEEFSKALSEVDPSISISPGNVQVPPDVVATRKVGALQDVIDDYVAMVADTPEEMKQALQNIAAALENNEPLQRDMLPPGLSEFSKNLLPDAVEKMKGVIGR